MGESKLLLALFCNKILTKSEQGVVVVVISWRSGCVTLTVTLQLYRGGECAYMSALERVVWFSSAKALLWSESDHGDILNFTAA